MTRRLPFCAACGAPLVQAPRIQLHYGGLPGSPTVGWCLDHMQDGVAFSAAEADSESRIATIEALDPRRVVAGPAWAKRGQP